MIDPFFGFFERERIGISQNLYGEEEPFKTYPDLPAIKLEDEENTANLSEIFNLIKNRKSTNIYKDKQIELETLSKILKYSVGLNQDLKHRPYPSGGAKYPTEVYVLSAKVKNLDNGIYHYNVKNHGLVKINNFLKEDLYEMFPMNHSTYSIFDAAVIIFLTFSKNRSTPKYGALAYKLGLIEAGHIGQNVYLLAEKSNLGCRGYAAGNTEKINDFLNIDGVGETVIYTLSLGFPNEMH